MPQSSTPPRKTALESFKDTIEALVMAFILAFVFRAFVAEAFVIPTGSMADTLRGAHFGLTCPACGYEYNYGFKNDCYFINPRSSQSTFDKGQIPNWPISVYPSRIRTHSGEPVCPMCGTPALKEYNQYVNNGDRILVYKFFYQFQDPKRWDVIVFKNPSQPQENYIKRLVALPEETIEIIDGDIYIDGTIQTKPQHIQEVLWIPVFLNDFQPEERFVSDRWTQPFNPAAESSNWNIDQTQRVFDFNGSPTPNTLTFNPDRLIPLLRSFAAYNGLHANRMPFISDLKLQFVIVPQQDGTAINIELGKYGKTYLAQISPDGQCKILDQDQQILAQQKLEPFQPHKPVQIAFAILDHQIKLDIDDNRLTWQGPNDPDQWGYQPLTQIPPTVTLTAQGAPCSFKQLGLYRDIYYTNYSGSNTKRGTEGLPFTLDKDEFFVCGDNSPESYDSRLWAAPGKNNFGMPYRTGIVPRNNLIGRALFVYWPAGYRITNKMPIAIVPNFGEMRFIH